MTTQDEKIDSGYQIINILLIENTFTRVAAINFGDKNITHNLDVESNPVIKDDVIITELIVSFSISVENNILASLRTKMVGTFKAVGTPQLSKEDFANVNAAAIIYPYIREQITSCAIKGGLGNLFIPPLNFTKKKVEQTQVKSEN
jgi:preprotein translocase subunit SecB